METNPNTGLSAQSVSASHTKSRWNRYFYKMISNEISTMARYYDRVIQIMARKEDSGILLKMIDNPDKTAVNSIDELPDLSREKEKRTLVLLDGNLNHHFDIQELLTTIKDKLSRTSRVVAVLYNPYLSLLYKIANFLKLRKGDPPCTFLTKTDLINIAKISNCEVLRYRATNFFPFFWLGIGSFLNWILPIVPLLRHFHLTGITILRPIIQETSDSMPSLSILIPARNERGNIESALKRMPEFPGKTEIIFIEGHSQDGTWEEIQRVKNVYSNQFEIKTFQQTGKGKSDAVRLGFQHASCDLFTILDADLTMPPELLVRFYDAYTSGKADFINGTRLIYPMEGKAMRFLNRLGNVFFAKALSSVLGVRLADSLCGTKLVTKWDYRRMKRWREDFGDFDPFGDFELLFPAAILGLGIVDIPIRYRARTYGSTQISRFSHGFMLLKMTLIGLLKVKMGKV